MGQVIVKESGQRNSHVKLTHRRQENSEDTLSYILTGAEN
jgi:hypothetical protein